MDFIRCASFEAPRLRQRKSETIYSVMQNNIFLFFRNYADGLHLPYFFFFCPLPPPSPPPSPRSILFIAAFSFSRIFFFLWIYSISFLVPKIMNFSVIIFIIFCVHLCRCSLSRRLSSTRNFSLWNLLINGT